MPKIEPVYQFFNVGVVDRDKTHLTQLDRVRLAAEQQTNLMGTITGAMFVRPGFGYIGSEGADRARIYGYHRSSTEKAIIELTEERMRVWVDDELVSRSAVDSAITNGDFATDSDWTEINNGGGIADGQLKIHGYIRNRPARAYQEVATGDPDVEHAIRVVIPAGRVKFMVGTSLGAHDIFAETTLGVGYHSLAFTPGAASFFVELRSEDQYPAFVESVEIEAAGAMELPTPWSVDDLRLLRFETSLDVIYVSGAGHQQRQIERRGQRSWSFAFYITTDGPFSGHLSYSGARLEKGASANPGLYEAKFDFDRQITVRGGAIGGLIRTFSNKKKAQAVLGNDGVWTDPVRVSGIKYEDSTDNVVYNDRQFGIAITGTWSGTLKTFRSFDGPESGYKPFRREQDSATIAITANDTFVNDDNDNNAIVWYRVGFDHGDYTSGAADVAVTYEGDYTSTIYQVTYVVGSALGANTVSFGPDGGLADFSGFIDEWEFSDWPVVSGFPDAVSLHDGRLFWAGEDRLWGSISDDYTSFDDEFEGDAGPINRAIAVGGSNSARWMMSLAELVIGTNSGVVSAKASELGEILTPADTTIKEIEGSTPCAPVSPVRLGAEGMFVDATTNGLHLLTWGGSGYIATEVSKLSTDLFDSGIVELVWQPRPDRRVWAVTGDGKAVCILYDKQNEILGFIPIETDGEIESLAVLPDTGQDRVYASVKREVNGNTVRYLEKMATDAEARPVTLAKVADSFVVATVVGNTVTVGDHLDGREVVVWANGQPLMLDGSIQKFTVESGEIIIPSGFNGADCVVGLPYPKIRYKSARLAHGVEGYNAFTTKKRIVDLGLEMTDFVRAAIRFGGEFDNPSRPLDSMRPFDANENLAAEIVFDTVSPERPFPIDSRYEFDSRLCIDIEPGCPAKFLVLSLNVETST